MKKPTVLKAPTPYELFRQDSEKKKRVPETHDPTPEFVYCDPSVLLDIESMSDFMQAEGIRGVLVNDTVYSTLLASSLSEFKEKVYRELKLWKAHLPDADTLYKIIRDQASGIQSKFIGLSDYMRRLGNETWQQWKDVMSQITAQIGQRFRKLHPVASEIIAEVIAMSHFAAIKTLAHKTVILQLVRRVFPGRYFRQFALEYQPRVASMSRRLMKKKKILFIVGAVMINLFGYNIESAQEEVKQIVNTMARAVGITIPLNIVDTGILFIVLCP